MKEISYSLRDSVKSLGLGEIISYDTNHFIVKDKKIVYCTNFSMSEIVSLQLKYGTGMVNYCPYPLMFCSNKGLADNSALIVNESSSTDNSKVVKIVKDIGLKISNITSTKAQVISIIEEAAKSKLIVVNGNVRTSVLYGLLSCTKTIAFVNCKNDNISLLLRQSGLEKLLCKDERSIPEVWHNRTVVEETLKELKTRMQAYISWSKSCKPFVSKPEFPTMTDTEHFKFVVNSGDYTTPYYSQFGHLMSDYSSSGGINFCLRTVDNFTKKGLVIMHPWVGIIETLEVPNKLLNSENFQASLPFCVGLFVYTREISEAFPDVNTSVIDFRIVSVEYDKIFDPYYWIEDRIVINLANPNEVISLNNTENESESYICSLDEVEGKNVDRLVFMASKGIPIALPRTNISEIILGEDYPFYFDDPVPGVLVDEATEDLVIETFNYLNDRLVSIEDLINSLEDTSVGIAVKNLYK